MAVRGFQPLYNLAFFERSLLPLPPSKDPFARNGTSGREFFAPSSEAGGRDACCIDVRSLFVCWLFVSPRSLTLIARRQRFIIPGFGNKTSPLSLSFLYKYSSVIWSEARDNVWWERRRNSLFIIIGQRERGLELIFQSRRGFRLEKHRTADLYWSP